MLKASALLYSIVFSIVILVITLFIVSSLYYSQVSSIRLGRLERANDNMESALAVLLYTDNNTSTIDLFKDGKDLAYVNAYKWGMYDIKTVTCIVGKDTLQKSFVFGYEPDRNYALNINSTDRVLNIAGRTLIKGNAYVPNGTFKRAYIEGRGSLSSNPIQGFIKPSPYGLGIDMKKLKQEFNSFLNEANSTTDCAAEDVTQTVSFSGAQSSIFSENAIHIGGEKIKGHCIIKSARKISVSDEAILEDVILIAPEIELESGFTGVLQCYASSKILVGKRSNLKYPSALCVLPSTSNDSIGSIVLGEDSKMAGTIVAFTGTDRNSQSLVVIDKGCKLYGQVFCEGYTQLQGSVIGNIQTGSFYLRTTSSIYDNTLLDAEIDALQMDTNYLSYFYTGRPHKRIVKWLY